MDLDRKFLAPEITDDEVIDAIMSVPEHYSANLIVDLGNTALQGVSISAVPLLSGGALFPCSGALVGAGIDMNNADTFCNLEIQGTAPSGQLRIAVQCADTDTSGSYTDPTSGLPVMPGPFSSGGVLFINSGGAGGGTIGQAFASGLSGFTQAIASGFAVAAGFQRTGRFVRGVALSGDFFAGPGFVSFISQLRTTGSGGGSTQSPGSGTVSV